MSTSKTKQVVHVAFADDHVAGRMSIAEFLKKMGGISVDIQADNGKELIAKLKLVKQLPDICILDVSMPKMNGLETLIAIKTRWPDMKFLIISAFASEHLVVPMIRRGAGGYLLKTCHPNEIKEALISIHETGAYHSEFVSKNLRKEQVELTDIELEVLKESCSDLTYAEIGAKLKKTRKSVEGHRDALFRKLHVKSRAGLVLHAIQSGIVPIELIP